MEVESEPEDGEILDELEEEEEKTTPAPHGSRGRRGGSRPRRGGNYAPRHDRRRHGHGNDYDVPRHRNLPRYNNMSERSGGISRTLEYVKYLRSFTERNKSISARRSSGPERRSSRNKHSKSRSPSPHRDHRKDRRRPRHEREVKHNVDDSGEKTLKPHSTGSTSSREGIIHVEDENGIRDIEEVSADEMQDNNVSSPVSSIEIVEKVSPGKAPEIITLDSTDTSEDDNTNISDDIEKVDQDNQTEDGALVTSNNSNLGDGDDDSEITDFDASFEENQPIEIIVINTVNQGKEAGTTEEQIVSENLSNQQQQTLGGNENTTEKEVLNSVQQDLLCMNNDIADEITVDVVPEGNIVEDEVAGGNVSEDVPDTNIVVDAVADGNAEKEPDINNVVYEVADGNVEVPDSNNDVEEVQEESIVDDQELTENNTEREQGDLGDGNDVYLEEEEMEQSHLSDEEIDVLELRNKLLADLVNKTDSSTSLLPTAQPSPAEIALRDLNRESLKILGSFESGGNNEEEEEALRAVVLSLMNKKKVEPTRSDDDDVNSKPAKSETPRPRPIAKRRSTNDENRSSVNSRRNSNSSNKNNRRSPPRRRPLPFSRRSSIGSRRTSREYERRRSRERDRISPSRDRDEYSHNHKTARSVTLSPPPSSSNRSKESASSSVSVNKLTLTTSRNCSKENNSSVANIRDLPENDLRKQLLRNSSLQKKTSMDLTSPNTDPVVPSTSPNLFLHDTDERVIRNDIELTIRRTVKFTDNGNENITTATPSRIFTQPVGIASMNHILPQPFQNIQRVDVPGFFNLQPPPVQSQNGLQFTGVPVNFSFGEQPIQQTLFTGTPFEHYRPTGHPHLGRPLIQHPHIQPNRLVPLTVSNTCLNESLQNNVHHPHPDQIGGSKRVGGNQKKRTRGSRGRGNRGKGVKPNRWSDRPGSANTNELEKTMSNANLGPDEKSSASPLPAKHSPDLIKAAAASKVSTSVASDSQSPLGKSTTVTPANNTLSLDIVANEPMKRLQKSSPYSSPVLSPALSTKTALPKTGAIKKHLLPLSTFDDVYSDRRQFPPRLIIPIRDDDSTSDDDDGKTNKSKGDNSCVGGNAQELGNDNNFQKSLVEFLKRAREESERKANERLSTATATAVNEKSASGDITGTENLQVSSTIKTTSSPPSSSSVLVVKKKGADSDKVNNIAELPDKSSEKPIVDSSVPNLLVSDGAPEGIKALSNSAPAKNPNSASTSEAHIGPSPMKKRRLLKANTNTTKQLTEHGSTEATESSTSSLTSLTTNKTEKSPTVTSAKVCDGIIQKEDKKSEQSSSAVPTTEPGSARTAVLIPKRMLRIPPKTSALLATKTTSLQQNEIFSSTKKAATTSSAITATKVGPSQSSPPPSKQIIDDLTRKIIESRDQLALSSKEKELSSKERELLHSRQSFSDGLRDIQKSLLQHTRLINADSKLQSEITSVEKRLEELKKRQVDVRTKASAVNKSIKEKSKSVLPTKASCISLERHVKNLGDSIMGVKSYKVTDLFTRDIETVVKDITVLHSRQPANHRSERGVMFHQVISGDIDPTSTLAKGGIKVSGSQNNLPSLKAPAVVVAPPATVTNPEKRIQAKTKPPQPLHNVSSGSNPGPSNQQNATHGQNIVPEKNSGKEELRFLTRHGRKSLEEKDEPVNEEAGASETNNFAGGDVLTEVKSSRVTLADHDTLTLTLSGF